MRAIRVHETGGPDVLRLEDIPRPEPAAGEVLVRIARAGVNFIDTYHRSGLYAVPLPFTPGLEAAGTVEAVGEGVTAPAPGDRVASAGAWGAYGEFTVTTADRLVPVPAGVEVSDAAAVMLQGMTAHYLVSTVYPLQAGDTCLVHAAAGGVGLLLCQMAHARGVRVIGTVGDEAKAARARAAGADEVILYRRDDVVAQVRRLTDGRGVQVAFDGVGKATWERSLQSLTRRGTLVVFGNASGPVPPVDPLRLTAQGSVAMVRPKLADFTADETELRMRAGDVLGWVADGSLRVTIHGEYPLEAAAAAHRDLESRATAGKLLLAIGR